MNLFLTPFDQWEHDVERGKATKLSFDTLDVSWGEVEWRSPFGSVLYMKPAYEDWNTNILDQFVRHDTHLLWYDMFVPGLELPYGNTYYMVFERSDSVVVFYKVQNDPVNGLRAFAASDEDRTIVRMEIKK
jgi:hypothetical protein